VAIDSDVQGQPCGQRIAVPSSAVPEIDHAAPLDYRINQYGTTVRDLVVERRDCGRLLRRGVVVK
jgi:hypothetical protein